MSVTSKRLFWRESGASRGRGKNSVYIVDLQSPGWQRRASTQQVWQHHAQTTAAGVTTKIGSQRRSTNFCSRRRRPQKTMASGARACDPYYMAVPHSQPAPISVIITQYSNTAVTQCHNLFCFICCVPGARLEQHLTT